MSKVPDRLQRRRIPRVHVCHDLTPVFGNVRQLDAISSRLLTSLARRTPWLAGADAVAYLDLEDTVKQTYGYLEQGAG